MCSGFTIIQINGNSTAGTSWLYVLTSGVAVANYPPSTIMPMSLYAFQGFFNAASKAGLLNSLDALEGPVRGQELTGWPGSGVTM